MQSVVPVCAGHESLQDRAINLDGEEERAVEKIAH
jgi:hypothetical protein